jgi:hypothetical protein
MKPFKFYWVLHTVGMTVFWGGVQRNLVRSVSDMRSASLVEEAGCPVGGRGCPRAWVFCRTALDGVRKYSRVDFVVAVEILLRFSLL